MKKECVDLIKNNPYRLLEPRPFWSAYPKRCFEGPPGHVVHLACLRLCLRLLGSQVWIILRDLKVLYTDINRKKLTWNKIQNSVKSSVCLQMILSFSWFFFHAQAKENSALNLRQMTLNFTSVTSVCFCCHNLCQSLILKFKWKIPSSRRFHDFFIYN